MDSITELFLAAICLNFPALTCVCRLANLFNPMLETIEKLLVLQDRDRKIHRVQAELAHISPEREGLRAKATATQAQLEAAKTRVKQIESERKRLEIEVESKKEQITKYANQQLQTRKNEEYRALAQEIEHCKAEITKIEDHEIELMEQAEAAQKEVLRALADASEAKKMSESEVAQLDQREGKLKQELAEYQKGREELAAGVDEVARLRYERLMKSKGDNVIVGINHGVCGGCHMKLTAQILVNCKSQKEIVPCINCGRILYYTRDMELVAAE